MELQDLLETVLYYRSGQATEMSAFYRDVLGLEQVSEVAFRLGGSLVLLFDSEESSAQSWPPPHGSKGPAHACFVSDPHDYEKWKARLLSEGVAIIDEIKWNDHVVSFYFKDPAGNVLEIAQGDMWPPSRRQPTVAVADTVTFVASVLPAPARVLDAGCGAGDVLGALMAQGYEVVGIDVDEEAVAGASRNGARALRADLLSFDDGPFDAVFFGRSLHHMSPLDAALERTQALLSPGGLLIAEEFALESVNFDTARWLYELDSILETTGMVAHEPHAHPEMDDPLERWRLEHLHDPPLATGEEMLAAIGAWLEIDSVERVPYLSRHLAERMQPNARTAALVQRLFELESSGIAEGRIEAVGLRVVARKR
jgi:SAM-dependent methyltransferase